MRNTKNKKREYIYLGIFILLILIGCIHTFYDAHTLYTCNGCSAPYTLAFIFPGGLYLIVIGILACIYYFIKKKFIYAWSTLFLLVLTVTIIVLNIFGLI